MRTRNNGFVNFMCKLDGKPKRKVKPKTYPLPEIFSPTLLVELLEIVLDEYTVGDVLSEAHQNLVDRALVWDTTDFEENLADLHGGEPLTEEMYEVFAGWERTIEQEGLPEEFPL